MIFFFIAARTGNMIHKNPDIKTRPRIAVRKVTGISDAGEKIIGKITGSAATMPMPIPETSIIRCSEIR